MRMPRPTTIDFETMPIGERPHLYPPEPVGVSVKPWGKPPVYYAWGHVDGRGLVKKEHNNSTRDKALGALRRAYANPDGVLFMNAKFDLEVAEKKLGLAMPPWKKIHDLMFLIFLRNPNEKTIGLKETAARYLDMPADERDAVADWLTTNQPLKPDPKGPGVKISKAVKGKEPPGKYIAYAPCDVVGPYANGDTVRTEALFIKLWQYSHDRDMLPAYDREREFMLCIMDMESRGIRVDTARLDADVARYTVVQENVEAWIRKRLKAPKTFNLDSAADLLEAMVKAGVADTAAMGFTKTGRVRTNKAAMAVGVADLQLRAMLEYRNRLETCLSTFMRPWLTTASKSGGYIYTTWNQVKQEGAGTRTGRMSSSKPVNFQNMPKEFQPLFLHDVPESVRRDMKRDERNKLARCPTIKRQLLPSLPLCRGYIIPYRDGDVLCDRDYSQQEPRILAHFEDGPMKDQYLEDPWIDFHDHAQAQLEIALRRKLRRKDVKTINLGIIYGMGLVKLAEKNSESIEATRLLRDTLLALYPGLKLLSEEMKARKRDGLPIRTWGGREYRAEPDIRIPVYDNSGDQIDVEVIDFAYKMVNTLIQGSAADCTKEAVIRYYRIKPKHHYLILQVHDQLVASAPRAEMAACHEQMREAMESVEFDVKILTEGEWSDTNWNDMREYDKKGRVLPCLKEAA